MRIAVALLVAAVAAAADRPSPAPPLTAEQQRDAVAKLMEASLAAQRVSVARQTETIRSGFFTLPAMVAAPARAAAECDPLDGVEAASLIRDAAARAAIEPELLHSVAKRESGLRPCAVSPKGAMGVMQLMPATARELGVTDPFDPAQSIDGGARLLRKYLDQYGNLPLALGAYNAGPARVNETREVPRIPETLDYVRSILSLLPKK